MYFQLFLSFLGALFILVYIDLQLPWLFPFIRNILLIFLILKIVLFIAGLPKHFKEQKKLKQQELNKKLSLQRKQEEKEEQLTIAELELDKSISAFYHEFSTIAMGNDSIYSTAIKNFCHMNHQAIQDTLSCIISLEVLCDRVTEQDLLTQNHSFSPCHLKSISTFVPFSLSSLNFRYLNFEDKQSSFKSQLSTRDIKWTIDRFDNELHKFSNLLKKENFIPSCDDVNLIKLFVCFFCLGVEMEAQAIAFEQNHSIPDISTSTTNLSHLHTIFSCFHDKKSMPEENEELMSCFYYCVIKGFLPSKDYAPVELYNLFRDSYSEIRHELQQKAVEERKIQQELDYKNKLFNSTPPQNLNKPALSSELEEFTKEQ